MSYSRVGDRLVGHDYPGLHHSGFVQYELDELELGARVAMAIDDPAQTWWNLWGPELMNLDREEAMEQGNR